VNGARCLPYLYPISKIPFCMKETVVFLALHEDVLGSGDIGTLIHNLGNGWMWVVSLTPGRFIPGEGGSHWIVGPRAGLDALRRDNSLILSKMQLRLLGCAARGQVAILTGSSWFAWNEREFLRQFFKACLSFHLAWQCAEEGSFLLFLCFDYSAPSAYRWSTVWVFECNSRSLM